MPNKNPNIFDLEQAVKILGGAPQPLELERLRQHYKTFEWNYRSSLLHGFFEGKSVSELVDDKICIKKIQQPMSKQSRGGHARWVVHKSRRYVMRLLYLRFRLDQGKSQIAANALVWKAISPDTDELAVVQDTIRKATHCAKLGD